MRQKLTSTRLLQGGMAKDSIPKKDAEVYLEVNRSEEEVLLFFNLPVGMGQSRYQIHIGKADFAVIQTRMLSAVTTAEDLND